jgi:hypothetical protein
MTIHWEALEEDSPISFLIQPFWGPQFPSKNLSLNSEGVNTARKKNASIS